MDLQTVILSKTASVNWVALGKRTLWPTHIFPPCTQGEGMTIHVVDERETDAHRFDDEYLFVTHPARDAKVAPNIHRVRGLEDEQDTESAIRSSSRDIDLTDRGSAWQ